MKWFESSMNDELNITHMELKAVADRIVQMIGDLPQ